MTGKAKIIQARAPRFVALCGRIFHNTDPQYFPRAEYRGRTIYLCTESCLGAFLADPDVFYKVHRNSEKTRRVETG
jgi:YHS domain-containing protein